MTDIVRYSSCYDAGLSSNSVTLDYWNINKPETRGATVTSAVITLCFILIGVPSNLLILASILRQRLYRKPTYIFLLNLTIADLLMCLLYMPFTVISGFAGEFLLGSTDVMRCWICQFSGLTFVYLGLVTLHILSLLSADRFLFIKCPLEYHTMVTCRRSSVANVCSWALCVFLAIPPLFNFGEYNFGHSFAACSVTLVGKTNNLYFPIFLSLEMIIPLTVLIVSNVWILHIIRVLMAKIRSRNATCRRSEDALGNTVENSRRRDSKSYKQLLLFKAFGAIFISNIITWTPFFINVAVHLAIGMKVVVWLNMVVFISVTMFAVIHPIIQAALIPEMKSYLVRSVRKLLCWHRVEGDLSSTQCLSTYTNCSGKKCSCGCLECLDAMLLARAESSFERRSSATS